MTRPLFTTVSIFALALSPLAAETLFSQESPATITVRRDSASGHVVTEQQKSAYYPLTLYTAADPRHIIARETLRTVTDEAFEGSRSDLTVDLFEAGKDRKFPGSPSTTLKIPNAHEAVFEQDYWAAITHTCCGGEPYGRLYAYGASRPFLRYNGDFWNVFVPNVEQGTRYVGLALRAFVPPGAPEEALFKGHPEALAVLTWAAPGRELDRLYLQPRKDQSKESKNWGIEMDSLSVASDAAKDVATPHNRLLEMWSLDGAEPANAGRTDVSGAIIHASLFINVESGSTTHTLTVKVENDKLVKPTLTGNHLESIR